MGYLFTIQSDYELGAIVLEVWDSEKSRCFLYKKISYSELQFVNVPPISADVLMLDVWNNNALTRSEFLRVQSLVVAALNDLKRYYGRPSDCPFIEKKEPLYNVDGYNENVACASKKIFNAGNARIDENKQLVKLALEADTLKSTQDYMALCDLCGIRMPALMQIIENIKKES